MSVAAPLRQRPVRQSVIESRPIRNPDVTSAGMMTTRGWWLVVLNFLLPGSAQVLAGSRKLGRFGLGATVLMWVLLILAGLGALLWPSGTFSIASGAWLPVGLSLLRPIPLLLVQGLFIAYAVLWIVLTVDTLRLVRLVRVKTLSRIGIPALAIVLAATSSVTAAYGAQVTGSTREALGAIFGASAPVVPPSDGYYNILLLGADSGEGRDSMRFDSISVVSVNADTGATTITGIPRDLGHFPFSPGPMQDLYPDGHTGKSSATCGWGSGINQLRTEVEVCRDGNALYPDAVANGSEPGVEATKDAAEGLLGITIPYYVFIDMHGFAAMIDALGGVDITVDQRLPKGAARSTPVSLPTTGRSGGSRLVRSTWTATLRSGTPVRAIRPTTSTACGVSASCRRRFSRSSRPRPCSRGSRASRRPVRISCRRICRRVCSPRSSISHSRPRSSP